MSAKQPQNYRIEADHPVLLGGTAREPAELDLSPDLPDYVTPDGVEVRIERKSQKTRFLDARGGQVGPVHRNLAPAIVWARVHGWRDPSLPQWFNDGAISEIRAATLAAEPPSGVPMSAHDLTDYPEALDEPRPESKPSGTARRMAALLREG